LCPTCGTPQVKVIQFRSKPRVVCLDPACPTNHEPEISIGECKTCAAAGKPCEQLTVRRSPRTLKRFVRCTNYDECQVSYPLPQRGELSATGEECPTCAAPMVVVETGRGPWKICIDPNCPSKAESAKKTTGRGKGGKTKRGSKPVVS
jgi:DNA topoisomerase-1